MIRKSFYSLLSLFVMGLGKAAFVLLTANLYGPEGQGIVTLGITVMVTVALLLGLGTEFANTQLVGQDPSRLQPLRNNSAALSACALIAAGVVMAAAFRLFDATIFKDFPAEGQPILVLLIALQIYHLQIQGLVVGLGNFKNLTVGNLLQYLLVSGGILATYAAGQPPISILYVWAAGLIGKTAYLFAYLPRGSRMGSRGRPLEVLRAQLTRGPQMMAGNLANLLNFRLDAYFIAYFLPASHLGWYAVASMIAEGTLYLPKAFGQVAFSWAAAGSTDQKSQTEGIRNIFLTASYSILLVVLAAQLVLGLVLPWLFGEPFSPAVAPTRVLLVAVVFYGIGLVAMNLIFGFGNASWNTRAGIVAAVLNAAGNAYAIPRWGILGAAYTSLISYAVYCVLNLANIGRYLPARPIAAFLLIPDRKSLAGIREILWRAVTRTMQ